MSGDINKKEAPNLLIGEEVLSRGVWIDLSNLVSAPGATTRIVNLWFTKHVWIKS